MNKMTTGLHLLIGILIVLSTSCSNDQTNKEIQLEDGSIVIPLNNAPIKTVNTTDENGLKQGTWQEDDREDSKEVFSITKEYNYMNDTLHGYYIEYKYKSADTLIYGNYSHGQKEGEWKYWSKNKNEINKVEIYKNGVLVI